jgi:parallel beta-helix repeat protein
VPIVDRDFPPDRLGRDRKHLSKVLVLAVILIAVLVLGATAGLVSQIGNSKEPLPSETPARITYTTHGPISIVGNEGFTNESGVVWGSGTESDPYIIEGWDINASTAIGIEVRNTDAHFIIRTCHVHDGGDSHDGININVGANGTLDGNNCSNNAFGIYLDSSNNNTLSNNNCSNCAGGGIRLRRGNDNILSNNTCMNNEFGMYLYSSNRNILDNNTCSPNTYGIYLDSSNNNTLRDNNCSYYDGSGINLYWSGDNKLINNNCSNNYNGIYLYYKSSGNILSNNNCNSNYQGIYLDHKSSSNILSNNNCSSNYEYGIYLYYESTGNTLSNNNCSNNSIGIYLVLASSGNTLNNNNCSSNKGYGICLVSPINSNIIWNNTLIHNNGATDTYDANHVQAYDDGTYNWWNSTDGYGNWWSDWQSPDNVLPYGIVDLPYNISGSAGAKDYYPLTTTPTEPIPEFGLMPLTMMVFVMAIVLTIGVRRRKEH